MGMDSYSNNHNNYNNGYNGSNHNNNNHRGQRQSYQKKTVNKANLPENERFTLKCTGIPSYVKEEDIKAHFESFGNIVKIQITTMEDSNKNEKDNNAGDGGDGEDNKESEEKEKKKTYNECLVQFYSVANAKKCLTSPTPVLNNRFIHVYQNHFNIILPSDVEPLPYEMVERDRLLLTQEIVPKTSETSHPGKKKPLPSGTLHKVGVSNKWRRTSEGGKVPGGDAASAEASGQTAEESVATVGEDTSASASATSTTTSIPVKESKTVKEGIELKQEFEKLKTLKQQAEDILKAKEKLLQVINNL